MAGVAGRMIVSGSVGMAAALAGPPLGLTGIHMGRREGGSPVCRTPLTRFCLPVDGDGSTARAAALAAPSAGPRASAGHSSHAHVRAGERTISGCSLADRGPSTPARGRPYINRRCFLVLGPYPLPLPRRSPSFAGAGGLALLRSCCPSWCLLPVFLFLPPFSPLQQWPSCVWPRSLLG